MSKLITESEVQNATVLLASRDYNTELMRNNSGAVTTEDGRHVRFGLGNDSKRVNKNFKSSDLIGICGDDGKLVAIECKKPGWKYKGDERERAQKNFIDFVLSRKGKAGFSQSIEDSERILKNGKI